MLKNLTPEKVIAFTRIGVAPAFCWPLPASATRTQTFCFKTLRFFGFLNGLLLLCTLIYTIFTNKDDIGMISKATCLVTACTQIVFQTVLSAGQYNRFQYLISKMETYCKEAKPYERHVLQRYVDAYAMIYGGCVIWVYTTAVAVILGNILLSLPIPIEQLYPFLMEHKEYKDFMQFLLSVAGIQCAAQVCANTFYALLLWFATAKYEILSMEFESTTNIYELKACIRKYQDTVWFSREICIAIRPMIILTISLSSIALIVCALTFITKQPLATNTQFILLSATALLEVLMCAYPADFLMYRSRNLGESAFNTAWYDQDRNFQRTVLQVILCCRQPVTVSFSVFLSALSLEYFSAYLSNAFSVFTTLRVAITNKVTSANETYSQ